jgi:hypothetical protein
MSDPSNLKPPETGTADLEHGIFNLVITLCKFYEGEGMAQDRAKERVVHYLNRLINGLQMQPDDQGEQVR